MAIQGHDWVKPNSYGQVARCGGPKMCKFCQQEQREMDAQPKIGVAEAMARQEGFLIEGSRACRNHNPGNIRFGYFAVLHGATSSDDGYAVFPTAELGMAAMRVLLEAHYLGKAIEVAIARWAPAGDNNDPGQYTKNVCAWTGYKPTDILTESML